MKRRPAPPPSGSILNWPVFIICEGTCISRSVRSTAAKQNTRSRSSTHGALARWSWRRERSAVSVMPITCAAECAPPATASANAPNWRVVTALAGSRSRHCLLYNNEFDRALEVARHALELASRVGHLRAEIIVHSLLGDMGQVLNEPDRSEMSA